ncbi:sensor histidine kinase [Kocuria rhizophila]|uniref:histidine kinase n=1 Tax=Kocuria rhizophila TaxID=72000 RepID=A0AAX2SFT6_KOCRH|nr:sensor histidine kinase [Kocuria rhizophila]KIC70421.1 histidine kinase [Kocuria rhizophila]KUP27167.1 histidine kinase [Kocuria rhizophila]MDA4829250.1 sensor histidine kinase [Kocuria rhizophila]MDN3226071.1 sensor histidine kinase [Kocuria rhizophila]TFI01335.1 sensor histidine kinase [Kocuria rhizophila]
MAAHLRMAQWVENHPHLSNAVLTCVGGVVTVVFTAGVGDALTWWCSVLCWLPLFFRRAAPTLTAFSVGLVSTASVLVVNVAPISVCLWAVPWVVYTAASRSPRGQRRAVFVAAILGSAVLGLRSNHWFLYLFDGYSPVEWAVAGTAFGVGAAAFVTVAHLAGDLARGRRQRREQLEDRARRLEIEREQEVRLAAQDERARIAREMHDVVAHSLSVVIAQADGARYAAASNPEVAVETLGTIAETARGSLTEMRKLLGVLRTEDENGTAPVPQLEQIEHLVASVRDAGLPVEYRVSGEPALSSGAQLTLYRVVQEAMTNVLKHAWQASSVRIVVEHGREGSWAEITNDGAHGATRAPRGGFGLQGLRERVSLYGGSLTAGPHPERSDVFVVRVTLPGEGK